MTDALIIDACRTPRGIGKAGKGALSDIHPQQLGAAVLKALAERTGINTAELERLWHRLQPLATVKMPLEVPPPRTARTAPSRRGSKAGQLIQPPNGSLSGTPSRRSSTRLEALPPSARACGITGCRRACGIHRPIRKRKRLRRWSAMNRKGRFMSPASTA